MTDTTPSATPENAPNDAADSVFADARPAGVPADAMDAELAPAAEIETGRTVETDADAAAIIENEALWNAARSAPAATPGSGLAAAMARLNPQQREAVETTDGPVLVVAGAGTGKTTVLTTRIANIIDKGLAEPFRVLAVTFTNKAAAEMRERIIHMIGEKGRRVRMGSFHAVSLVMLRHHPKAAGLKDDRFMILDEADQEHLTEDIARDLGLAPEDGSAGPNRNEKVWRVYVREHRARLMSWKEEGWTVEDIPSKVDLTDSELALTYQLYKAYQEALAARNACDFADLILHMVRLFRTDAAIRDYWAQRFHYIMVDEFQDTNPLQYEWLTHLARNGHGNLCVVGDTDQSIYQWRNARPEIMLNFPNDWPGTKVVTVDINYRSTQEILDVANAIVARNPRIGEKRLNSPRHGDAPKLEVFPTHYDEAVAVATRIAMLHRDGHPLKEIAVLFRSAGPMRGFEEQLMRRGIPYIVVGGMKFHEREEVKDALAYLRLAVDPMDELAFLRIANKPTRGIGDTTAMQVLEAVRKGVGDFAAGCRHVAEHGRRIRQTTKLELQNFAALIAEFNEIAQDESTKPGDLIEHMLERVAYITWRIASGDQAAGEREESLKEMIADANEYTDIASYLQTVALLSASDVKDASDHVRLSTIHASKGLEFDTVFTPCLEEGVLPNQRALNESYGLEEERRIAHVAWTRARTHLHMSCAQMRHYQPAAPSHFLREVGLLDGDYEVHGLGAGRENVRQPLTKPQFRSLLRKAQA